MITIVCVGNVKEAALKQLIQEYQKRLSKPYDVTWIELAESKSKTTSQKQLQQVIDDESTRIMEKLDSKDSVVLCDVSGKAINSIDFSKLIDDNFTYNTSNLVFVIGGSYGVNETLKKRANTRISFSKLTFPHQLFRVILIEQIYRAYTIVSNITYHK